MDHSHATEVQAAERYLLGELPADEAEEFERHFFECADCAQAVEAGTQFIANARAVFTEGIAEPGRGREDAKQRVSLRERLQAWWSIPGWVPAAAALALALVAVYQGAVVIPGLRQGLDTARALPAFQLAGLSRGEGQAISVPSGTPWLALSLDVPPDVHFSRYLCVVTAENRTLFRVESTAPSPGQPITILVPTRTLSPGAEEFTVYGLGPNGEPRDKVAGSFFQFQIR
ncbi:MAG TPA: zf-HC2 domain-containing protein [Bryobacteraceae bacterium]|jgi:hypothetical protein